MGVDGADGYFTGYQGPPVQQRKQGHDRCQVGVEHCRGASGKPETVFAGHPAESCWFPLEMSGEFPGQEPGEVVDAARSETCVHAQREAGDRGQMA